MRKTGRWLLGHLLFIFVALLFVAPTKAALNSPSAAEIDYSYQTDFVTAASGSAEDLARTHARYLFGYLENHSQSVAFGLSEENDGIGAPLWPSKVTVIGDSKSGGSRHITYNTNGRLIAHKYVSAKLLNATRSADWPITLPYDLDHFFIPSCGDWDSGTIEDFWYSYDPFKTGCESLQLTPLAKQVILHLQAVSPQPLLSSHLDEIRGDGRRPFVIATIDGFDSDLMAPNDLGRASFQQIGSWFTEQGFSERIIAKAKDSEIHRFDKIAVTAAGLKIPIQILRFLGESEITEPNSVAYARFMIRALREADVIVYQGHSGFGRNMQIHLLEARAGQKIRVNNLKRQIFFFDSCTSYSYYVPIFSNLKKPGLLDLVSNGIESMTERGVVVDEEFYRALLDVDLVNPSWNDVLGKIEARLDGVSFLINVFRQTDRKP